MSLDTDLARQFGELMARKKELEEEAKEIARQLKAMETPLRESMAFAGVDSLPIKTALGKMTVYLHSQLWAKPKVSKADACAALKQADLGEFVAEGFNTNTVSAFFREHLKSGETIPSGLLDAFSIDEVQSVRARRASSDGPSPSEVALNTLRTQTNTETR
jgi:hypothetical protein